MGIITTNITRVEDADTQQRYQRRRRAAALHTAIAGCQLNALHMRADVDVAVALFGSPTVCESLRVSRTPSAALFTSMLVLVCLCVWAMRA